MASAASTSPVRMMIDEQIVARGVRDNRVLDAIAAVPRERFVPQKFRAKAYDDCALAIGHDQTISQPYMVALMTEALDVRPSHRVLEVGTGSGYQAAVLAQLADVVFTVERIKPLLDQTFERLAELGIKNVRLNYADGSIGWPERAPFDRIMLTAGAPYVANEIKDQLCEGGVLVAPVGPQDKYLLTKFVKQDGVLKPTVLCDCRFVPLIGQAGWPA